MARKKSKVVMRFWITEDNRLALWDYSDDIVIFSKDFSFKEINDAILDATVLLNFPKDFILAYDANVLNFRKGDIIDANGALFKVVNGHVWENRKAVVVCDEILE